MQLCSGEWEGISSVGIPELSLSENFYIFKNDAINSKMPAAFLVPPVTPDCAAHDWE